MRGTEQSNDVREFEGSILDSDSLLGSRVRVVLSYRAMRCLRVTIFYAIAIRALYSGYQIRGGRKTRRCDLIQIESAARG